jgi:NAD(P)H-dependent flavin oxidoreductase YrpB (nitropropane dioxygenase family)
MPPLTTPLCRLLGIAQPIIQAPISSSPELVAAVSNAGGMGVIQSTWLETDELIETIAEVQRRTDRPFAANFVLSLTADNGHALVDAALAAGAPVISTFWADPAAVIERIHGAGALALHTVGSAEEARRVVDLGVDAVVAQGVEAGGHVWGQVGTLVLTPAVVDAVPDAHVIAAGGIADGRGLAAVLALGAGAAWIGTRFLLAEEHECHPAYRDSVIVARETDTVLSSVFDVGWPDATHRCLLNDTLEAWLAAGSPEPGQRPNEGEIVAHFESGEAISRYSMFEPTVGMTGRVTSIAMYAGQGVGLTSQVKPIAEIMSEMVADATAILSNFSAE